MAVCQWFQHGIRTRVPPQLLEATCNVLKWARAQQMPSGFAKGVFLCSRGRPLEHPRVGQGQRLPLGRVHTCSSAAIWRPPWTSSSGPGPTAASGIRSDMCPCRLREATWAVLKWARDANGCPWDEKTCSRLQPGEATSTSLSGPGPTVANWDEVHVLRCS